MTAPRMPCINCGEHAMDHQGDKCLFAATLYAPIEPEDFQAFIEKKMHLIVNNAQTLEVDVMENGVLYRTALGPGSRLDVPTWEVIDDPIRSGELESERQKRWHSYQNNPRATFVANGVDLK